MRIIVMKGIGRCGITSHITASSVDDAVNQLSGTFWRVYKIWSDAYALDMAKWIQSGGIGDKPKASLDAINKWREMATAINSRLKNHTKGGL